MVCWVRLWKLSLLHRALNLRHVLLKPLHAQVRQIATTDARKDDRHKMRRDPALHGLSKHGLFYLPLLEF